MIAVDATRLSNRHDYIVEINSRNVNPFKIIRNEIRQFHLVFYRMINDRCGY